MPNPSRPRRERDGHSRARNLGRCASRAGSRPHPEARDTDDEVGPDSVPNSQSQATSASVVRDPTPGPSWFRSARRPRRGPAPRETADGALSTPRKRANLAARRWCGGVVAWMEITPSPTVATTAAATKRRVDRPLNGRSSRRETASASRAPCPQRWPSPTAPGAHWRVSPDVSGPGTATEVTWRDRLGRTSRTSRREPLPKGAWCPHQASVPRQRRRLSIAQHPRWQETPHDRQGSR
jgi:hypothetical protein